MRLGSGPTSGQGGVRLGMGVFHAKMLVKHGFITPATA